jgi:hypothetical protein
LSLAGPSCAKPIPGTASFADPPERVHSMEPRGAPEGIKRRRYQFFTGAGANARR